MIREPNDRVASRGAGWGGGATSFKPAKIGGRVAGLPESYSAGCVSHAFVRHASFVE